jgi:beta-glucosidase
VRVTRISDVSAWPLEQQVSMLSGADFWRTTALPEHDVPSVVLSDGPHGLRFQQGDSGHLGSAASEPATCFPPAVTLASTWDEALVAEVGRAIGVEARAVGVGVVLGPGLNIKRHPLCGRNFEYFSEDPLLSGHLAAAFVRGVQSTGTGACVKHFAVNNQESHRFVVDAVVDERSLREIYLPAFEHVVGHGRPWAVMAAYNRINGEHATDSRRLLTEILRDEWGFDGLVMSDWAANHDRVAAVAAGLDLEMPSSGGLFDADVVDAVRTGRLSGDDVARCVRRVVDLAERANQQAGPPAPMAEHDALARRAAAEGTVLLTNDGVLPLSQTARVAVIGAFAQQPRYQGSGSSRVNPTRVSSVADEMRRRGLDVRYARGYDPADPRPDPALVDQAVALARTSDVAVVLVGLPARYESEGFDRSGLDLPAQHDALVAAVCAASPRTVVALSNGAPVAMPWADQPAAILEGYLGGQAGGAALVDVLLGDADPSGRLAETFPGRLDDVAADDWFPGHPHQVEYREGLFVGYRHAATADRPPLFPFGHGLGFDRLDWRDPALRDDSVTAGSGVTVRVTVRNSAQREVTDVLQVYLHDATGVVLRPDRELAAFAKLRLAPGEQRTVELAVPARAFAFYDVVQQGWRTPTGRFDVLLARSSADVVAALPVRVTGGVCAAPEGVDVDPVARSERAFAARLGGAVPRPRPIRPFVRDSTLGELAATRTGRVVRSVLRRVSPVDVDPDDGQTLMHERALDELPLRAAAIFSGGAITWPMVDAVIAAANGQPRVALTRGVVATGQAVHRLLRMITGRER